MHFTDAFLNLIWTRLNIYRENVLRKAIYNFKTENKAKEIPIHHMQWF